MVTLPGVVREREPEHGPDPLVTDGGLLTDGRTSGFFAFACGGALAGVLGQALRMAKELDQPGLALGKRVPAPLREHKGERAHVP